MTYESYLVRFGSPFFGAGPLPPALL